MRNQLKKGISIMLVICSCLISQSASTKAAMIGAIRQDVQPKQFKWADFGSGDCVMSGLVVTFYPNGVATITATVWTNHTHSGDTWHFQVVGMDYTGNNIIVSPSLNGPDHMNDGGARYQLNSSFNFDPALFYALNTVSFPCNC